MTDPSFQFTLEQLTPPEPELPPTLYKAPPGHRVWRVTKRHYRLGVIYDPETNPILVLPADLAPPSGSLPADGGPNTAPPEPNMSAFLARQREEDAKKSVVVVQLQGPNAAGIGPSVQVGEESIALNALDDEQAVAVAEALAKLQAERAGKKKDGKGKSAKPGAKTAAAAPPAAPSKPDAPPPPSGVTRASDMSPLD